MKNQEYTIPQTQFHPDLEKKQEVFEQPVFQPINNDAYMMKRYLEQVETSKLEKARLEERQSLNQMTANFERTRDDKIKHYANQRRNKVDVLLDIMSLGIGSVSKTEAFQKVRKKFIEAEANLGGSLIPSTPNEIHRFHYHDQNEWFWHVENKTFKKEQTIRYKVDELSGIFRSVDGKSFEILSDEEYANFLEITRKYIELASNNIYSA